MESRAEQIKPYDNTRGKAEQVEQMFDSIAPAYDFMNGAMSFGMHRKWRDKALEIASRYISTPKRIIDLATGTGDVAIALARKFPLAKVNGVDLSAQMLSLAHDKLARLTDPTIAERIHFEKADCLNLPFESETYDLATIAYGVRNFENLDYGFREICRILKLGGVCMILELSRPENRIVRTGYDFYSGCLIPLVGKLVSKDTRAYSYLPESIKAMPKRSKICEMLQKAGFKNAEYKSLTLGVVTVYMAEK